MEEKAFELARQLQQTNRTPIDLLKYNQNLDKRRLFLVAYAYFLLSISNENTRSHYKTVIDQFIRYMVNTCEKTPLEATGLDVSLWRDDFVRTGGAASLPIGASTDRCYPQANSSIENKTSIISALFKFLRKPGMDGSPPLMDHNPVHALHTRFKIEHYGSSKKIDRDTLRKILAEIDTTKINGLRDYALIYGYFITGRRNTEWVSLKWGQLNFNRSPATYTFVRKGQKATNDELPDSLVDVLFSYLKCRWGDDFAEKLAPDSYLFTALPGKGGTRQIIDPNHHITERSMLRIIKTLARKAGLDASKITVHSLRHLHAETYLELGASVEEVRARLGHESLTTTQRYASSMKNEKNRLADKLDNLLNSDE